MRVHARPLFLRTVFQILFLISQSNGKKEDLKNPDLDFLIEIHPEDGFLGGEIRFRIFPIERTLSSSNMGDRHLLNK